MARRQCPVEHISSGQISQNLGQMSILFWTENTLFGQIWSKNSKLSVWTGIWYIPTTDSDMMNSVVMFAFSACNQKHLFWEKSVPNFKIACLKGNLVSDANMQNSIVTFTENILLGQMWSKKSILPV